MYLIYKSTGKYSEEIAGLCNTEEEANKLVLYKGFSKFRKIGIISIPKEKMELKKVFQIKFIMSNSKPKLYFSHYFCKPEDSFESSLEGRTMENFMLTINSLNDLTKDFSNFVVKNGLDLSKEHNLNKVLERYSVIKK